MLIHGSWGNVLTHTTQCCPSLSLGVAYEKCPDSKASASFFSKSSCPENEKELGLQIGISFLKLGGRTFHT